MSRTRANPSLLALAGLSSLAQGQTGPPPAALTPFQETVAVSLVQVPVSALDRERRPVLGLTAADFELSDDGRPVEIRSLDVIEYPGRHGGQQPSAQAPLPVLARRKFVLLFDLSYATPSEVTRARKAAVDFVRDGKGADDLVALATISIQRGFRVVLDFTADPAGLRAALEERGTRELLERLPLADAHLVGAAPIADGGAPPNATVSRADDSATAFLLLRALDALAGSLAAIPGRKHVIYLSRGFDERLLESGLLIEDGNPIITSWDGVDRGQSLRAAFDQTLARFRECETVIHSVDVSGVSRNAGRWSLARIAAETGGEALAYSNDLLPLLGKVIESTSVVYVLGFSPSATDAADRYHRLTVKVRRKGVTVHARAGYFEGGRPPMIGAVPTPKVPGQR